MSRTSSGRRLCSALVEGAEASGTRLPTLKRIISAGAPVSASLIERLARLLDPPAQIHTPYGATESLPVASIGSDEILSDTRGATDRGLECAWAKRCRGWTCG